MDGQVAAGPLKVLQNERLNWANVWQANEEPPPIPVHCMEALPRKSPEEMRAASRAFSQRTAATVDGFHLRQLEMLEDQGLVALACLLEAVEIAGRLPPQLRFIIVALIPKPTSALRPIGAFPCLYRFRGRLRRDMCLAWEQQHPRSYLAAGTGRSAVDAVWRQAVRAEATAHTPGTLAVSVLWDASKFYERFSHPKLVERAEALGFPMTILRVALFAYRSARHLATGQWVTSALYPARCGRKCKGF